MAAAEEGNWPAWANEPVRLVDPDPRWPLRAATLAAEVVVALDGWLVTEVEHVGSTAVPELPAKPVIDLMAGVVTLSEAAEHGPSLDRFAWALVPPDLDVRPWRRLFVKVVAGRRVAHLHLLEPSHPRWREQLAFRDRLRADPEVRDAYAALKRCLAAAHATDRERYTAEKATFIRRVLDEVQTGG